MCFGAAGDGFTLTGRCGFTKSSLCACRNDETFTDSFTNYTNIMLPGVIILPQLKIFLKSFLAENGQFPYPFETDPSLRYSEQ